MMAVVFRIHGAPEVGKLVHATSAMHGVSILRSSVRTCTCTSLYKYELVLVRGSYKT